MVVTEVGVVSPGVVGNCCGGGVVAGVIVVVSGLIVVAVLDVVAGVVTDVEDEVV